MKPFLVTITVFLLCVCSWSGCGGRAAENGAIDSGTNNKQIDSTVLKKDAELARDASGPLKCPADLWSAQGKSCNAEGKWCSDCPDAPSDLCQLCNTIVCQGGKWVRNEGHPNCVKKDAGVDSAPMCPPLPSCNWCNGSSNYDSNGCVSSWTCDNGVDHCSTPPCFKDSECKKSEYCGKDMLCWPVQP